MINTHKILRICSVKSVTCYPVHSNVSDSALFIRQDHFMPCQVPLYSHYSVVRCRLHPVYIVLCCVVNNDNVPILIRHEQLHIIHIFSTTCQKFVNYQVPVKCCQPKGECFLLIFKVFLLTCCYFCKTRKRKYHQPFV